MLGNQFKKVHWVADHIHGSIPMSAMDMALISTEIYNRLHNVLQNSTVYFTFPANRTDRFIHSIGCAHLAGKIFQSSVMNASDKCLKDFFSEFRSTLTTVIDESGRTEAGQIRASIEQLNKPIPTTFSDRFYHSVTPAGLSSRDQYYYILLYQAIRFAALLHDIGHPPFSHVVEFALAEITAWLRDKKNKQNITPDQEKLLIQLEAAGPVFHEALGHKLAPCVLDELYKIIPNEEREHKRQFDFIRIKHLTIAILDKKPPFFESVGSIVSGSFDADRLDYVSRDSIMCGLRKAPIEMIRLIDSFHLLESNGCFRFAPSTRALSTVEEFFRRRFNVYKYAIFHHRVVKLDALMQTCVFEMAKQKIQSKKSKTKAKKHARAEGLLRDDISGLWQVLERDCLERVWERADVFIQWDDAWLLSVLRLHYFCHPARHKQAEADDLFFKLEELLSNTKRYYSVFKRADTFSEVDTAFLENIPTEFDWSQWDKGGDALSKEASHTRNCIEREEPLNGFFLNALFEALHISVKLNPEKFLRKACNDLKKEGVVDECFFCLKRIKAGVNNDFVLANSNGLPVKIGQVSRVVAELREAGRFFPPFFIFVRPPAGKKFVAGDLKDIRKKFGELMAKNLLDYPKGFTIDGKKGGA